VAAPVYKAENTAVGIAGRYSSLAGADHGVLFQFLVDIYTSSKFLQVFNITGLTVVFMIT
jgi:hypothetical protein